MNFVPYLEQHSNQTIYVDEWEEDEFGIMPLGQKPKRNVVCPAPPPAGYLLGNHRYLFKEPGGPLPGSRNSQQIWSEIIAYKVALAVDVDVPPAFLAFDRHSNSPGVLLEYFYGPPSRPDAQFVHAIERFQATGMAINTQRGSLASNLALCRLHLVQGWREWWARTVAFDTLIGNQDRHSENWGFLLYQIPGQRPRYELAPVFDNGSSFGCGVREGDLRTFLAPDRLASFIRKGRHHYDWLDQPEKLDGHAGLCRSLATRHGSAVPAMAKIASISDAQIDQILQSCVVFDYPVKFSPNRAEFVRAQIRARRESLAQHLVGLGG